MAAVKTFRVEDVLKWSPVRFAEETHAWGWVEKMIQSGVPTKELVVTRNKLASKETAKSLMRDICSAGHLQLLQLALSIDKSLILVQLDNKRNTPLHIAATNKQDALIRVLLEAGADFETRNALERTPLHAAAASGSAYAFRLLLDAGANPDQKDATGNTPLQLATEAGHVGVMSTLCISGAAHAWVKGQLLLSAETGNVEGVRRLMKYTSTWGGDWSDLHYVAAKGSGTAISTVLAAGLDANAKDANGDTPLHAVAAVGRPDAARVLVHAGADVSPADSGGSTPLHYAVRTGNILVARVLLEAGADVDARDAEGDTPLHRAATRGSREAVAALVAAGARTDIRDATGRTPQEVARLLGYNGLFEAVLGGKEVFIETRSVAKETPSIPATGHWRERIVHAS